MKKELQSALENVEMTYGELVEIANDIIKDYVEDVNEVVETIKNNIETLSNEDVRKYMLLLSCKAFSFGEVKEKSSLKADCAEILKKEKYAKTFNGIEGTVATKENLSQIEITNEVLIECIYNLVSSLFKVKLEEIRRMIDVLRTILVSRNAEAKLSVDTID